jgi:hypothetical protein
MKKMLCFLLVLTAGMAYITSCNKEGSRDLDALKDSLGGDSIPVHDTVPCHYHDSIPVGDSFPPSPHDSIPFDSVVAMTEPPADATFRNMLRSSI